MSIASESGPRIGESTASRYGRLRRPATAIRWPHGPAPHRACGRQRL